MVTEAWISTNYDLTMYEAKVLKALFSNEPLKEGAATNVAVEVLYHRGFVTFSGELTEKGRQVFETE